jgi:uncharacterized protein
MRAVDVALVVIAKAPVSGRAKTRLCPPFTPAEAAALAHAALVDTLETVARTPARRRVLMLDGEADGWHGFGLELHSQRGDGLGERLAHALGLAGGPALVVGMDTPQLTPALLEHAARELAAPEVDAVIGPALDGGYWTIGLCEPDARAFHGVPMSSDRTYEVQRRRLAALGMRARDLPPLRDVDTGADAAAVARLRPQSRFAEAYRRLSARHTSHHQQPMTVAAGGGRLEPPHR